MVNEVELKKYILSERISTLKWGIYYLKEMLILESDSKISKKYKNTSMNIITETKNMEIVTVAFQNSLLEYKI